MIPPLNSILRPYTILPLLLWSAAPLVSRPPRHLSGSVTTYTGDRRLNWSVDSGLVQPAENGESDASTAVIIEGEPDDFVLVALGRLPLSRFEITGDVALGRGFLSAFFYQAGPVTLFNM